MFQDRVEAGKKLANALEHYQDKDTVIYALPRGGVVVAAETAKKLQAPMDLIIIRKIGHPDNPEYAICSLSENGHVLCNEEAVAQVEKDWLEDKIWQERQEIKRRQQVYLNNREAISAKDRVAVIVDDGIATGLTMATAIEEVKHQLPKKIVVAVPVIPKDVFKNLKQQVDEVIALETPEVFAGAVGSYYEDFPQVTDEEVIKILKIFQCDMPCIN